MAHNPNKSSCAQPLKLLDKRVIIMASPPCILDGLQIVKIEAWRSWGDGKSASSLKGEFSCIEVVRVVGRGGRSERALQIHVVSVDVEPLQKTEPCAKLLPLLVVVGGRVFSTSTTP